MTANGGDIIDCVLPVGWRDRDGAVHRAVRMRPARARDELRALGDFRVHLFPETLPRVLLARVIVRLGTLDRVDPGIIASLDERDLRFLAARYLELNGYPGRRAPAAPGSNHPPGCPPREHSESREPSSPIPRADP